MATYDSVAEQYKKAKTVLRPYFEEYTFFYSLGDIGGKSILDLACGEGIYTRKLKALGASRVVGLDISEKMLELARLEEARVPQRIEYLLGDARKLGALGSFDLVVAVYLLHYAQTKEDLLQMCQSIFANLKPGGRFVTLQTNHDLSPEFYHLWAKYQPCTRTVEEPIEEGAPITLTFKVPDGEDFSIDIYYHSRATYEWAFQTVGFREIHWQQSLVSPEGVQRLGQEFWQDALDYPPLISIECMK